MKPHFSRPVGHTWEVQNHTGYPSGVTKAQQWDRGVLYRIATPKLSLAPFWPMFDPSDPSQYNRVDT
jgi:hypothetical protein